MQQLVILGATGTIGRNTLDVAERHPERFTIFALTAHRDVAGMRELCLIHKPAYAVMADGHAAATLRSNLQDAGLKTEVLEGMDGIQAVVSMPEADQIVAGIVGAAGLLPVLRAIEHDKRVLLANKEPLVMAGALVMQALSRSRAEIIPLDSEHNAVFQCLPGGYRCGQAPAGVVRILLTASGGPFRNTPLAELENVTPAQAVAHPNWNMGRKISVDSATMMNKGLETIEAAWLFGLGPEQIEVVLHPQSLVHSFVEYRDSSVLAQLGQPDMRTPIAQALASPERIDSGVSPLSLQRLGQLDFEDVDLERYPCLALANEAAEAGGHYPNVLNAANEVAVDAFLQGEIPYLVIPSLIRRCLDTVHESPAEGASLMELEAVLAVDDWARGQARAIMSDLI